jgi:16S rRNA (uracil1498-N3)-methyltransferase
MMKYLRLSGHVGKVAEKLSVGQNTCTRIYYMKIHRFLLENGVFDEISEKSAESDFAVPDSDIARQMIAVLRLEVGEHVELFNEKQAGIYIIESIGGSRRDPEVRVRLEQAISDLKKPERRISMAFGISKRDAAEWIVQKCTEIGVSDFYPIVTDRTEKKQVQEERLVAIIKEAVEQSGWHTMSTLHAVQDFDGFVAANSGTKETKIVMLDGNAEKSLGEEKISASHKETIVCVGPEGGFTDRELTAGKEAGWEMRKLGNSTLRTETAALAAASLLLL